MPESSQVLARYAEAPLRTRAFLRARWAWTPYRRIASLLPRQGEILDLACGHGLLCLALASDAPKRRILGVDHDPRRIRLARAAAQGISAVRFKEGDFSYLRSRPRYSGIAMIDVLHYFSPGRQREILREARRALLPGGILIFREMNPKAGFSSLATRAHEVVMTRAGLTRAGTLNFRSIEAWTAEARRAGFSEVRTERCERFPYADILFICQTRTDP